MDQAQDDDGEGWWDALDRIEENMEHLHQDLRALRAHLGIPRPECYPLITTNGGRAERAQEE